MKRFHLIPVLIIFIGGALAASHNWLWAKGFMALWLLIFAFNFLPVNRITTPLRSILIFVTLASSISGLGIMFFPSVYSFLVILFWLGTLVYLLKFARDEDLDIEADDVIYWPLKKHVIWLLFSFGVGALVAHKVFGLISGQPCVIAWWTPVAWSALGIMVSYPRSIGVVPVIYNKRLFPWGLLILAVGIFSFHVYIHLILKLNLEMHKKTLFKNEMPSVESIRDKAIKKGYIETGITYALIETQLIFEKHGWEKAAVYHRSIWGQIDKERLARAFREGSALKDNYFLFTVCYGCNLILASDEEAVDFGVLAEEEAFLVLTSKGRLLRLGTDGMQCIMQDIEKPAAIAFTEDNQSVAVLSSDGNIRVITSGQDVLDILVASDLTWNDISFNQQGDAIWALNGSGGIAQYAYSDSAGIRGESIALHPPLWGEPDVARSFAPVRDGEAFLLLDKAGGIHWRSATPLADDNPTRKQLLKYYNPNRMLAAAVDYWAPEEAVMFMEQTGRTMFTPIAGLMNPAETLDDVMSETEEEKTPVSGLIYFSQEQSSWIRKIETVSMAPLPQVNTLFQLRRNGTIQAIAMPQRHHIRIPHEKYLNIDVGNCLVE